MSRRVIAETVRCIVLDAEKEHKHDGENDRERDILVIDRIMSELEAHGLEVVEIKPKDKHS